MVLKLLKYQMVTVILDTTALEDRTLPALSITVTPQQITGYVLSTLSTLQETSAR